MASFVLAGWSHETKGIYFDELAVRVDALSDSLGNLVNMVDSLTPFTGIIINVLERFWRVLGVSLRLQQRLSPVNSNKSMAFCVSTPVVELNQSKIT